VQRFGNNCAPLHFGSKFYKLGRWSNRVGLRCSSAAAAQQPRDKSTIGISVSRSTKDDRLPTTDSLTRPSPSFQFSVFSVQSGFVSGQ